MELFGDDETFARNVLDVPLDPMDRLPYLHELLAQRSVG